MKVGKRKRKVLVNQNSKQLQKRKEKQAGKVRKITQKKECEGNRTANRQQTVQKEDEEKT